MIQDDRTRGAASARDDVQRFGVATTSRTSVQGETFGGLEAQRTLGVSLMRQGSAEAARPHLERVYREVPDNETARDLAICMLRVGDYRNVWSIIEPALPSRDPGMLAVACEVLLRLGRAEDAARLLDGAGPIRDARVAISRSQVALVLGDAAQAAGVLAPFADMKLPPRGRRMLMYQIGDANDALGRHDTAFDAYHAANQIDPQPFDAAGYERAVDQIIDAWGPGTIDRVACRDQTSDRPVFIVGMPRSGTTLVERLVASHPGVFGAGELTMLYRVASRLTDGGLDAGLERLAGRDGRHVGEAYLAELDRLGERAARVTDKNPMNLMHVGMIAALFPSARVIMCERDARDTCLSCYFKLFGDDLPWSSDLASIAAIQRSCARLTAHWEAVLPGFSLCRARYEDVIADPEGEGTRLVEFLGLEPGDEGTSLSDSDAVKRTLRFDQMNNGVYGSSIGKWKHYEKHLGPMLGVLGDG